MLRQSHSENVPLKSRNGLGLRAARRAGTLVGQTQGGSDPAVAARRGSRNPLARTGGNRRDPVRLAGPVFGWRGSQPEGAGRRCGERTGPRVYSLGGRSRYQRRRASVKNTTTGGIAL